MTHASRVHESGAYRRLAEWHGELTAFRRDLPPSMGAEDFSFMLQTRPGAYLRLGQGGEGGCFLHNSRYDFNDEVLPLGAAMFASLAERAMPLTEA